MKEQTKRFILIILIFLLMLLIPVLVGLLSERDAAREISELGGEYHSILPLPTETSGEVSAADITGN